MIARETWREKETVEECGKLQWQEGRRVEGVDQVPIVSLDSHTQGRSCCGSYYGSATKFWGRIKEAEREKE